MNEKDLRRIPSAGPSITQAEIDLVSQAIKDGWGPKMSYYIDEFTLLLYTSDAADDC